MMLDDKTLTTIRLIMRDEVSSVSERLANLETIVKLRHDLSKEHNLVSRVRDLEKCFAHLTGKVVGASAMASIVVSLIIKYVLK